MLNKNILNKALFNKTTLFKKVLDIITRFSLGKELALALALLHIIDEATESKNITNLARFVFGKLPQNWRSPQGSTTETEFVEMIQAGQSFLQKVKAALQP